MLNTSLFTLFLITSALTVATPGPGVLMTLTSSIRYGLRSAVYVILGTATGTVVMAAISSTSLGILIATSPAAYEVIKGLGALYMVYLGVRLFRAKPFSFDLAAKEKEAKITVLQKGSLWLQGVTLQMTNPMLIMFFISLFPQFIDHDLEIDFPAEMRRIQAEMKAVMQQEKESQAMLLEAFRGIGYGID